MRNALFPLLILGSLLLSSCSYIAAGNAKILQGTKPAQALSPSSLSAIADLLPTDKRTSFHVSTLALSLSMLANIQQDIGAALTDAQKNLVIQQTKESIVSQVSTLNVASTLALAGEDTTTTPTETPTQSSYATTFVITGVMQSLGGDASPVSDISTRQTVIEIGVGSLMNSVGKTSDTDTEKISLSASIAKNTLNGLISLAKIPEAQAVETVGAISQAIITHTEKAGLSASLDTVVNQMTTSMVASLETAGFSVANVSSAINQFATSTMQAFSKISLDPVVLQQKNMLQGMMNSASIGLNSLSAEASDKGTYLSTMVGSTIAHLPDAGVSDATDKTTLIGNVVTGAVQNMASAGFSTSDTVQIALKQISQQATSALAQAGFISSSDVSTLSNHIIASGISSLSSIQIEKSNTDITSFAGKMMEGALFSLGAMQTAGTLSTADLSTSVQSMINKGLDRMSTSYAGTQTELPNIAISFVNASLSGLAAGGTSAQNIATMQGQFNTSVSTNLQTHGVSASDADVSSQVNSAFSQAQNLASLLSSKNFTACESAFPSSLSDTQFLSAMSTMASTSNKILCQTSTTACPEKRTLSTAQYTWQKSSLSTAAIPLCELIYAYHGSATTYAANTPFMPSDSTSTSTSTESDTHTSTTTDTTIEISGFIHQLFVTSTTYNQNLTYHGLSGSAAGDAICQSLASTNPSLSSGLTWKMLVPSAFDSVETQLTLLGPVVNLRNPVPSESEFLSTTTSAFFSGTLHAAPKYTEKGDILASGSTAFGLHAPSTDFASLAGISASCGDFHSVYNRASYYVANPFSTTSDWAGSTTTSACSFDNASTGLHYYCLSLPGPVIPTRFTATGPNSAGHVSGSFTTPSGTNLISKIVISRKLGVQPYACGTGSFVKQYLPAELPANTGLSFTDAPVNGLYRYSMCVYDTMSQVVYTTFSDPVLLLDPATPKTYAFFTEDAFDGKMSSPYGDVTSATANTRCQVAATRAKLVNSAIDWKAFLSYSSGSTAASMLSGISSIYSVQEEFLSDGSSSWFSLPGSSVLYTEWGRELVDDWTIWTGSTSSGDNAATPTCNGWIINLTGSYYGTSGTVHPFSSGWFSTGSPLCSTTAHVLCLSHVR